MDWRQFLRLWYGFQIQRIQIAIGIFQGAKGVPWQPNLGKNQPKLQQIQLGKNFGPMKITLFPMCLDDTFLGHKSKLYK